uniref:Uncharacterized protein n=1 Tax=Arundo donax TaxID=35708 RepID=A0A0A8YB01_ARUDO
MIRYSVHELEICINVTLNLSRCVI